MGHMVSPELASIKHDVQDVTQQLSNTKTFNEPAPGMTKMVLLTGGEIDS